MRSVAPDICLCWYLVGVIILDQGCGYKQKNKIDVHTRRVQLECEDINDTGCAVGHLATEEEVFAAKSETATKTSDVASQCIFREKAPQQTIINHGMQQVRSPLLQGIGQQGLTRENAVQFALVNNPELFAYYENLEIGYAGLIEAGLRENPVVSVSARYPDDAEKRVNRSYDTAISFLDYFLIPYDAIDIWSKLEAK